MLWAQIKSNNSSSTQFRCTSGWAKTIMNRMKVLVTGSAGHLGEALMRTLKNTNHEVIGVDIVQSDFTSKIGSITDRDHVKRCLENVDAVFHTASLHKPHIFTHSRQSFVDTNIT